MWKHFAVISKNLSLRISLLAFLSMAVLLFAALLIMFSYSRETMKEDALSRASHTLDGANGKIDNILLSVEETAGNMYYMMLPYLNNRDSVAAYSRRIVEKNPYVTGCAIAMKPYFFPGKKLFMAYYHRKSSGLDAIFSLSFSRPRLILDLMVPTLASSISAISS